MNKDKKDDLNKALMQVNKALGSGSVKFLGEDRTYLDVQTLPTGSLVLDSALGVWGLPLGRIVEIYGNEGAGKTTVALFAIAEAQKRNMACLFVDVEYSLDQNLAEEYGVNLNDLIINQPNTGEEALDVVEAMIRTGLINVVVVDSVSALVPAVEAEASMGTQQMGLQARLMSKGLRKLAGVCAQNNCVLIFINQIREKIGGYGEVA